MKKVIKNSIFLILFLVTMIMLLLNKVSFLDDYIYKIIYGLRNNIWDFIFINITKMGNTTIVLLVIIVVLLKMNHKNQKILSFTAMITVLSNQIIKNIIKRPRPNHIRLIKQGGYSFPSGHAMISIAVYGFLLYYIQTNCKNKKQKILLSVLLTIIILMIGCSRVYVGVHYPTDIIGGYCLSIYILKMVIYFCQKYRGNSNEKNGNL